MNLKSNISFYLFSVKSSDLKPNNTTSICLFSLYLPLLFLKVEPMQWFIGDTNMSNTVGGQDRKWREGEKRRYKWGEKGGENGKEANKNRKSGKQRDWKLRLIQQLQWQEHEHPPNTHTHSAEGFFLTAKHVLLHCFLWVENYSGPDRLNDKLSKRQHVCLHTHTHTKHSVGYHIYTS